MTGDEAHGEQVYDLYKRGSDLLEHGDFSAATIPLVPGLRARITACPVRTSVAFLSERVR